MTRHTESLMALAKRRAETAEIVRILGLCNDGPASARYRLAWDAMMQAERDYRAAVSK